ncbi:DUF1961 family protein [Paenibacillus sp. Leaf72]|uniref:DUF1961 family protein n=1 Tax=Paenibacillus sp. Leaf72 TaxID=1736234 RepID=UPI000701CAEB|nr:DUF1961 family protein [Paenibacillus sp. Leaf72]KQN97781.1 hypothetical protein ASF12_21565 [Paenibacillus sp. Leaf72]
MIPAHWKLIYDNPLSCAEDMNGFRAEGDAVLSFPQQRLRLASARDETEGQQANFVLWCPHHFPADVAIAWDFRPIAEPGLAILFFAAEGRSGEDLFDCALAARNGPYEQYHHGDINALHLAYFRRRWPEERQFHTCNLRKSYGFHLVAQGADPLPGTADCAESYRMLLVKRGGSIYFSMNELPILEWKDDGVAYGPLLGAGKIGFRQMAPLVAEYTNLKVYGEE